MTSLRRQGRPADAPAAADFDETILVWNGVVARTERSRSEAARLGEHARDRRAADLRHDGKRGAAPA
jgi:hypothetical protein